MSGEPRREDHLVALPGTDWKVWRQAVLRTTGFPVEGLRRLCAVGCAEVADAYLDARVSAEEFDKRYDEAIAHSSREIYHIAGDPLFREAVTWQSRSVLPALAGLRAAGLEPRRTSKHRQRERIVARYWQRYCAKTETIGFFGPVCWVDVDPGGPAVTVHPGPGLVRNRMVFLEDWALTAYADAVSADPLTRTWLAPAVPGHLRLDASQLLDPNRPPITLSRAESAVLECSDGQRPAVQIAREVVDAGHSGLHKEHDVYLVLNQLAARGLLRWNIDLPVSLNCESSLRDRLGAIGDDTLRGKALAGLDRLCAARDAVAVAANDPDALAAALGCLETEFTAVTGQEPVRKAGQMYAGRSLCWEDTTRDLDLVIGGPLLQALAAPLSVLLRAARWVCAELAEAYLQALGELYAELAHDLATEDVPLGQLWFLAQGAFYGSGARPADAVMGAFSRRWAELFGLPVEPSAKGVTVASAHLTQQLDQLFPSRRPGWSDARLHSPDLQLCAASVADVNRGKFTVVLGELHVAWATNASGLFVAGHRDPEELRDAHVNDVGRGRLRPLLPTDWPRHTARLAFALADPSDVQLAFAQAPGAELGRTLAVSALTVNRIEGRLVVRTADGRSWPLAEVFARQLSELAVDTFKLAGDSPYTPRITIDQMVVTRRAWRTSVAECALATVVNDRERYLAARAWRRRHDFPERVFVKISTETKPTFVDFTSPLYVDSFAAMLRSAWLTHGEKVSVAVTEMLPDIDQTWVPDAAGSRYVSELRLHIRDPLPIAQPCLGGAR